MEIVPDVQGDAPKETNSYVWIPSLKAVIAGDVVFNGVHPWLAATDAQGRARWHQVLDRIGALHPTVVVAGHKRPDAPDTPDVLEAMNHYLTDFDATRASSANADALIAAMKQKYPQYRVTDILEYAARAAYSKGS